MKVGVIDYGVGNLGSVLRALEELDTNPSLVDRPADMHLNDCLILPGVGNFSDCALLLRRGGWIEPIRAEVLEYGRRLLGICVGMQLLADYGAEGADPDDRQGTPGLGLIPGQVEHVSERGCELRLPHVGWNEIAAAGTRDSLLADIPDGTDFYFTHSYTFVAQDPAHVIATVDYGVPLSAAVRCANVWGTQFHPEKSSRAGFKLLRNFVMGPAC